MAIVIYVDHRLLNANEAIASELRRGTGRRSRRTLINITADSHLDSAKRLIEQAYQLYIQG